eukprot:3314777-Prymnesium_polylepis.2
MGQRPVDIVKTGELHISDGVTDARRIYLQGRARVRRLQPQRPDALPAMRIESMLALGPSAAPWTRERRGWVKVTDRCLKMNHTHTRLSASGGRPLH